MGKEVERNMIGKKLRHSTSKRFILITLPKVGRISILHALGEGERLEIMAMLPAYESRAGIGSTRFEQS